MHVNDIGTNGDIITTFCPDDVSRARVIMWVQFLDGLLPKIWDGENRSKSGAISDNFDFDREYLRNRSTNRKSKKYLINYDPSDVGLKVF